MTISAFIALLAIPAAAQAPPAGPLPPPPIFGATPTYRPPERMLLKWTMGEVRCGDRVVVPVRGVMPSPSLSYAAPGAAASTLTMRFRIDAAGRPLGVTRVGTNYVADSSDVAPALVATRFAPGAVDDCRVDFAGVRTTLDTAPLADLRAVSVVSGGRPDPAVFRRVFAVGSDCADPPPEVRLRGFPAFDALAARPGEIGWSMTGFDIDAGGRPVRLATVAGSGDAALDRASLRAVADSRFAPGARHGCVYPYVQRPAVLPAPEPPEVATFRPAEASCPVSAEWVRKPVPVYPAAYNRRSIEGWAVIGFDVAPWGATGNIRVLAAEPAADFGDSAMGVIRAATKPPSATGATGCVERVRYKVAPRGTAPEAPPVPPVD